MNKIDEFDKQLQGLVNSDRMKDYGHPADHFAKSAMLKQELFKDYTGDLSMKHAMEMVVDKLVRLSHSPYHLDSWIDVAGYARTAVMVMDRHEMGPERSFIDEAREQLRREKYNAGGTFKDYEGTVREPLPKGYEGRSHQAVPFGGEKDNG
jgi:hypothetical protein